MIKKLLVALCAFAFISQTDALAQGTSDKNHNFKVAKNLETFSAIYKYLDMMYVDTLNADEVIGNGIQRVYIHHIEVFALARPLHRFLPRGQGKGAKPDDFGQVCRHRRTDKVQP